MTITEIALSVACFALTLAIIGFAAVSARERRRMFDAGYALAEDHNRQWRECDKLASRIEARIELIQEMRRLNSVTTIEDVDHLPVH